VTQAKNFFRAKSRLNRDRTEQHQPISTMHTRLNLRAAMPTKTWSAKRERQYAHIKDGLIVRGTPEPIAEEIAARVVNRAWAQHDGSVQASPSSINDISGSRRGGLRPHEGAAGRTVLQLRNEARQRGVTGRSSMNKAQLAAALTR